MTCSSVVLAGFFSPKVAPLCETCGERITWSQQRVETRLLTLLKARSQHVLKNNSKALLEARLEHASIA